MSTFWATSDNRREYVYRPSGRNSCFMVDSQIAQWRHSLMLNKLSSTDSTIVNIRVVWKCVEKPLVLDPRKSKLFKHFPSFVSKTVFLLGFAYVLKCSDFQKYQDPTVAKVFLVEKNAWRSHLFWSQEKNYFMFGSPPRGSQNIDPKMTNISKIQTCHVMFCSKISVPYYSRL